MDSISSSGAGSISSCDVNTNFNDRCQVDWSDTNLISFVSLDGIYILKPQLDVQHGPFRLDLIRNLSMRFFHQPIKQHFPFLDSLWQTFDQRKYMQVFLDPTLMTCLSRVNMDQYPRRFRMTKWSPIVRRYPKQCLLAAITSDCELLIFDHTNEAWSIMESLSVTYDKLYSTCNLDQSRAKLEANFETIQRHVHALSFCNMCWKELPNSGPVLLASTIPGDIVFWLLKNRHKDNGGSEESHRLQFEIGLILSTKLISISLMSLFDNLLVVAARNGQVVLLDLTENLSRLDNPKSRPVLSASGVCTLSMVDLPLTATLWHQDNIEVTDFYVQPITRDTFRVVLAKSTNICWCIINYTKTNGDKPASLAISDSFSAIDGLDPDILLHQTPASWLRPAGHRGAVLIADDGSFFQLEFVGDLQDTTPEFNAIRTDGVDLSHMVPRGLCTSPGGHLVVMISCITMIYETAKILAPTKVMLLPVLQGANFFSDSLRKLLDEDWLVQEKINSPMDVNDRIDHIRSLFSTLNSTQQYELFTTLESSINGIGTLKNDTQLVKLKIAAFLIMKLQEHSNFSVIDSNQYVDLDKKVYDKILLHSIDNILNEKHKRGKFNPQNDLSVTQVNSMRSYIKFASQLESYSHIKDKYSDCIQKFELQFANTPEELCCICQAEIPFESTRHATCKNQHRFNRCGRSLLVLSLTLGNEHTCEHCRRHFTATLVWPTTNNLWLCCYCQ